MFKLTSSRLIESLEPRRLLAVIPVLNDQILVASTVASAMLLIDPGGAATFVNGPDVPLDHPQTPALSPDRTRIVFVTNPGNLSIGSEINLINVDGTGLVPLTHNMDEDIQPQFSPDGSKIVFVSDRDGNEEIYEMNADGTNTVRLTNNAQDDECPAFSHDGTKIVWDSNRSGTYEIYTMDAGTGGNLNQLTNNLDDDSQPTFSPDGDYIAFISDRAGHRDIWAMKADGSAPGQISITATDAEDLSHPSWSPDGSAIACEVIGVSSSRVETFVADDSDAHLQPFPVGDTYASPVWASAPTFSGIFDQVLTVHGTSGADNIAIASDIDNGTATLNGTSEQFNHRDFFSVQIFCGEGNDTVDGSQMGEPIYATGDAGDDLLMGGQRSDTLTGGAGRNKLFGNDGNDRLNGSGGRDIMDGGAGADRMYGNGGNDYMIGGSGVDRMWGGAGDDLLSGNSGNDKMFGEEGNDQLLGGDGNDLVYGGNGLDTMNGGKGTDTADTLHFDDVSISIEIVAIPV